MDRQTVPNELASDSTASDFEYSTDDLSGPCCVRYVSDSSDASGLSRRVFVGEVEVIQEAREWAELESDYGTTASDFTHRGGHRNMASAIDCAEAAVERKLSKKRRRHIITSRELQAMAGVVIFFAVNGRILCTGNAILLLHGMSLFGSDCMKPLPVHVDIWIAVYSFSDLFFTAFQLACVYRDRALSTRRFEFWRDGCYIRWMALHLYAFAVLGLLSGWQLLRSARQFQDAGYRDSFLVELSDPGMVNDGALAMPMYSSHLTFLFEMPFAMTFATVLGLRHFSECGRVFVVASCLCLLLVVIALIVFDRSISRYIRDRYKDHKPGLFAACHFALRVSECLARNLTFAAAVLQTPELRAAARPVAILLALDYAVGLTSLCVVSGGFTKRAFFVSWPLLGANIAIFVDDPSVAKRAHIISAILDAIRSLEFVAASMTYSTWLGVIRSGVLHGDSNHNVRVTGLFVTLVVSMLAYWILRFRTFAWYAVDNDMSDKTVECDMESSVASDGIFGDPVDRFQTPGGPEGLAALLFSKGIGDQFASLTEIFCERHHDTVRLSRLHATEKLGEGGFGRVYRVRDTKNGFLYALKLQRRDRATSLAVREAECLHDVVHPFVVRLIRVFRTNIFYAILMELCQQDLNRCIIACTSESGCACGLPVEQVQRYSSCIALALAYLHGRSMIFRDLKPENVLTTGQSEAKLADFGLARSVAGCRSRSRGVIGDGSGALTIGAGTRAFMPAEAFDTDCCADALDDASLIRVICSRDWYAFGCTLLLMLLGERAARTVRVRSAVILLPPMAEDLLLVVAKALQDPANNPESLQLVSSLVTLHPSKRAGFHEVRNSEFLKDQIADAEIVVAKHMAIEWRPKIRRKHS